ncbi:hypothetical protein B9Z55_017375 [Caenorhabditis nigoni]|uniref:Receptor L-domain domain-containing protein n=1 Tax=Caenorhabditis nigoni TaxID=1611254 RepID=A0A2G5T9G4_9PELO|nr:hypothetical protein B9Z55_017375 [Caenorhabditis nigoni]
MLFNQYSDIPVFELQSYFAKVSVFKGSIGFEQSKYASIEFLAGLKSIECEPSFGDIENISAELSVVETDFESLSFLKNLKTIRGSAYTDLYDIDIRKNWNLTRFGIPLLRNLIPRKPIFRANFEANHDDFCFTSDEFKVFLENKVVFGNLNAKLCENDTSACVFKNMKDLKSNCSEIQGNISINSGDDVYIEKLKSVRFVWGSLTVQDTNITDLSFLESLEYAVSLNSSIIPIRLISNKMLESAKLPNLKRVFSQTQYQISFENSGNGFLNSAACLDLMQNTTDTVVIVDGKQCEVIDRTKDQEGNNYGFGKFSMANFLWIIFFIMFAE